MQKKKKKWGEEKEGTREDRGAGEGRVEGKGRGVGTADGREGVIKAAREGFR